MSKTECLCSISVAAAVIEKEGQILITKRKVRERTESMWEFPGGKIEKDETPEECLKREIKEELDMEIEVRKCISVRTHTLPSGKRIKLYAYIAEPVSGSPKLIEHEDARWVSKEELLSFDFYEPDLAIVNDLLKVS